jgi:hypothetical protein
MHVFSEQLFATWRGMAALGYRECPSMIGETSRFHSLARKKAKEKRTLVKWPDFVT